MHTQFKEDKKEGRNQDTTNMRNNKMGCKTRYLSNYSVQCK